MICTYCQQAGHTARTCPRRPGQAPSCSCSFAAMVTMFAIVVGGCAQQVTVAPSALSAPPAELMVAPPEPEDIPACEAQRECRVRYYAKSRADRAMLADRLRGLQRWVRVAKGGQ